MRSSSWPARADRGRAGAAENGRDPDDGDLGGIDELHFRSSGRLPLLGFARAILGCAGVLPTRCTCGAVRISRGWRLCSPKQHHAVFVWASNGEDGCERWKRLHRCGTEADRSTEGPSLALDLIADLYATQASATQTRASVRQRISSLAFVPSTVVRHRSLGRSRWSIILAISRFAPLVLWIGRLVPDAGRRLLWS